jgi:hypothetical protein
MSCAAVLAGAGLLLTGCSSAGSSSSAPAASDEPAPAARAAAPLNAAAAPAAGGSAAGPAFSAPSAADGQAASARLLPSGQSIIYTATMTVVVRDPMTAASRASAAAAAAGGYTAGEQARAASGGSRAQVSLTLKVPVPAYPAALARLGQLGRQTALAQQSSDVTEQVADVGSRVASQQAEIAQLRALLGRAGSVPDLLQVQDQLASDESSLESLQAQQRALDRETTFATITAVLVGPVPAAHRAAARSSGFGGGLAAGWHGLRHATAWLLTVLGAALPFLGVLAVLAGLAWLGRRGLAALARLSRRAGPAS